MISSGLFKISCVISGVVRSFEFLTVVRSGTEAVDWPSELTPIVQDLAVLSQK